MLNATVYYHKCPQIFPIDLSCRTVEEGLASVEPLSNDPKAIFRMKRQSKTYYQYFLRP